MYQELKNRHHCLTNTYRETWKNTSELAAELEKMQADLEETERCRRTIWHGEKKDRGNKAERQADKTVESKDSGNGKTGHRARWRAKGEPDADLSWLDFDTWEIWESAQRA